MRDSCHSSVSLSRMRVNRSLELAVKVANSWSLRYCSVGGVEERMPLFCV